MIPALVFSTAYALSGFVAAYSWDIMWMDCILLFPLIMVGLEKLVREQKPGLYFVTLALSVFANYYISIMICIFLVFYFILLFFTQKGGKLKAFFTVCMVFPAGRVCLDGTAIAGDRRAFCFRVC